MRKPLNVFFAIGKYFIPYFTVSLTSLLETNKGLDIQIFLIYDFDDLSLLDDVVIFIKEKYGISINLIFQDSSVFKDYRIAEHVSVNTYLRLLLPELIPPDVDSGLFLDSDTVVSGSLEQLAAYTFTDFKDSTNEAQKYVYAVQEIPEQSLANSKRITEIGYPIQSYFNAGIMLVNLKNWRLLGATNQLLDLANKHMEDLVFWDQDVLNMYFANKWTEIDKNFNALHLIWKESKTPLIIHYAGSSKPWNYLDRHPYKDIYLKYLKMTPFKEQRYTDFSFKKMPYKYYRDLRHFLNYYRQLLLGNLKNNNS